MYDVLDPTIVGFVLNIKDVFLFKKVKKVLMESMKILQAGERAYIFNPRNSLVPRRIGESIAQVAKLPSPLISDIGTGMLQTVYLLGAEDYSRRIIYVFFDSYKKINEHNLKMAFRSNQKEDFSCRFVLCGFGEFDESIAEACDSNCFYKKLESPEELAEIIEKTYRGNNGD